MRALLLVDPLDQTALAAAADSGADGLVLDLEGAADARAARTGARTFIASRTPSAVARRLYARVHALDDPELEADLDALVAVAPDGFVLPRAVCGADVQILGAKIAVREAECGAPDGAIHILAEAATSAASIFELSSFAGASRRLSGLLWSEDRLAASLGCAADADFEPMRVARSLVLFAAAAASIPAFEQRGSSLTLREMSPRSSK
jgi:citrate lyase subunit beta/citryl-CoA lyase